MQRNWRDTVDADIMNRLPQLMDGLKSGNSGISGGLLGYPQATPVAMPTRPQVAPRNMSTPMARPNQLAMPTSKMEAPTDGAMPANKRIVDGKPFEPKKNTGFNRGMGNVRAL
jgi:hypothetical protein